MRFIAVSKNSLADGPLPMMRISSSVFCGMPGVGRDLTTILPRESNVEMGINCGVRISNLQIKHA